MPGSPSSSDRPVRSTVRREWWPLLGLILLSGPVAAVDLTLEAAVWRHDPAGDFTYDGDNWSVDEREDGLGLGRDRDAVYSLQLRHEHAWLPELRLRHTRIRKHGEGETTTFSFGGVLFLNEEIETRARLDQTDLTLTYPVLQGPLRLDAGLNVRYIDGMVEVAGQSSGDRERAVFTGPVPMAHLGLQAALLPERLFLRGEVNAVRYDRDQLTDLQAGLRYEDRGGFALELGYRTMRIRLDDFDGVDADVRLRGPYAALAYQWGQVL